MMVFPGGKMGQSLRYSNHPPRQYRGRQNGAALPEKRLDSLYRTIADRQRAVHGDGKAVIMRDDQRRCVSGMDNIGDMFKHLVRSFGVEIAGWFIGQQDARRIGHRSGHGNALLFTA
jgi:hypothetical protein